MLNKNEYTDLLLKYSTRIYFSYLGKNYVLKAKNLGRSGHPSMVNPDWWRLDYDDGSEDTFIAQFESPEKAFKDVYEYLHGAELLDK